MRLFAKPNSPAHAGAMKDFEYLPEDTCYFDSACQTLRPQQVIDSLNSYFREYNACGGRVKYAWGRRVDEEISATRNKVLSLLKKSPKEYECIFTLNTTYGINLLLTQLKNDNYQSVITSEIEHNSVFLPTIELAKRLGAPRLVLPRDDTGALVYEPGQLEKAVVVVNSTSSIDERRLTNAGALCRDVHERSGIVILDGAQTVGHDRSHIEDADYDALCFSVHKTYGPSLGVIVVKRSLIDKLEISFVGGGMVEDVLADSYTLTRGDLASRLEPGLQDFGGIIALNAALGWLQDFKPEGQNQVAQQNKLAEKLFEGLSDLPLNIINSKPGTIISFYSDKIDAHRLAVFLSEQDIMVRSGYFCCHYYLIQKRQLPPLVRISLGLNNTEHQVDKLLTTLKKIMENI